MPSETEITVRYNETDRMGVVHHAVYPVWFEIARTDYIKNAGMSYSYMEESGIMLPVAKLSCRYRQPAKYDDVLVVTARITRLSPARIEFFYTVTRKSDGALLTEGESSHGFVDSTDFKPTNFKKAMPELYARMEEEFRKDQTIQGG